MSGGGKGGTTGVGFIDKSLDKIGNKSEKLGKKIDESASDVVGSAKDDPLGTALHVGSYLYGGPAINGLTSGGLGELAGTGVQKWSNIPSQAHAGYSAGRRVYDDAKDQAVGLAEKEANAAENALSAATAAAIDGRSKDPTYDEIVRQRQRNSGRRGTILTPGKSLGDTTGGKKLLGL